MKKRVTIKMPNVLIIIVTLFFLAIIIKLYYVVFSNEVDGVNLRTLASSITTVEKTLYADRGSIFDINGEEFASSVNSYNVIAYLSKSRTKNMENPQHVVDKEATAKALAPILNMSEERILELLSRDKYQVELGPGGNGITESTKVEIEKLELSGIGFISNSKKRYYSKGTFAAYIIGYAKKNDAGDLVGELGIESYFNDELSGINGSTKYLKYTSSNYQIPNTPEDTTEAINGSDIYLTIDSNIQFIVEKTMTRIKKELKGEWAIFTVMDANTGAIVASATNPGFDPNDMNTIEGYMNPLVSYQYEPGSVMKIFSFASAIEEGKYDGDETYKSGSIEVDKNTVIRDSNRDGWGVISFDTGFAYSSNVAATTLALRLGVEKLNGYYDSLGFGKKTGIELANEVAGDIDIIYKSELATASFGQGITVTPIEMLEALSAITNGGTTLKPYIVDRIINSTGSIIYEGKRTEVKKVFSEATVNKVQSLMHNVVYEGLTTAWQAKNVAIIGKTGTAQIASSKGGYLTGEYDYIRSFAGIFPEESPKYIFYVAASKIEMPVNQARPLSNIITTAIEEIASYAKITDSISDVDKTKLVDIGNYISTDLNTSLANLENKNLSTIIIGDGKYIINQYPLKNTTMLSGSKLFLLTNGDNIVMPDMQGWSLNEVKTYATLTGLRLEYTGFGYVVSQSITKDEIIDNTMTLNIELK